MRVVLLTNRGSRYGLRVLAALRARGVPLAAVGVLDQPPEYHLRLFRWVRRRVGLRDAVCFGLRRVWHGLRRRRPLPGYAEYGVPVVRMDGRMGPDMTDALAGLEPDLLVLGQTGIVPRAVLDIPAVGTLNAHPGVLPHYRGMDSALHALLDHRPDRVGVSVHWVDAGVDTGPVIRVLPARLDGVSDVFGLDGLLEDMSVAVLADVCAELHGGAALPGEPQAPDAGRQYYKMPRRHEAAALAALWDQAPGGGSNSRHRGVGPE